MFQFKSWMTGRAATFAAGLMVGVFGDHFTGKAFAADMAVRAVPTTAAPAPYLPTVNWQGAYGGLMLGYGGELDNASAPGLDLANNPHGFTYGGRLGYDWQPSALVFGVVTDISGANFSNSTLNGQLSARTNWWGTSNVRTGLTFANQLLYVTGGLAYGGKSANVAGFSASDTSFGWDAGVGIEGKFSQNWSAFLEGKYIDLGNLALPAVAAGQQPFRYSVVQGGVNYHF